ncbi:MAG: hypothetical protein MJA83_08175 [Gammaproteobacteria bacterium]|nr:hypothetical protein [Gammaproteobacteria bacterium]
MSRKSVKVKGRFVKGEKFYLAEIPLLDARTQGHNLDDLKSMINDWLLCMYPKAEFRVSNFYDNNSFEVEFMSPETVMLPLDVIAHHVLSMEHELISVVEQVRKSGRIICGLQEEVENLEALVCERK